MYIKGIVDGDSPSIPVVLRNSNSFPEFTIGFLCGDCKHCVSYFTVSRLASRCLTSVSSNTSSSSSHIIVSCETLNLWWKASSLK
ncbi:hypothetical protein CBS115989_2515 [Aspergillus niger]|nr:hypothetical protein CBS115989_2515 [Aspergillus niger]KAI2845226.1 hypothetical protein CBS11350_4245 [Aspergillus niger]KAI2863745.1 hypothetical protein CBS12448_3506 [Aspergillus niger]KAI2924101.1 hypothetical protein CBS147371_1232 [Aspergillus niger]KAI2978519.1 hypothetical protein CBS147324_1307 [Aspergillus niger]